MLFARDLVIVLVGVMLFRTWGIVVAANRWGKYTTACMGFTALSYVLQAPAIARAALVATAAAMVLVSSFSYVLLVRELLQQGESDQEC